MKDVRDVLNLSVGYVQLLRWWHYLYSAIKVS